MSKTSVAQGQDRGQGESPGNGGASLLSFKGGVPEGIAEVDQRKTSGAPPPAPRAEAEALGLVPYKTSITVLRDEQRLRRVRHGVMTSVRMMEEQRAELQKGGFRLKPVFITLTYGPGADWGPRDITGFLEAMREYMRRKGEKMVYCWVGEIQEQRASRRPGETSLHYHVMLWVPYRMMLPMPDERGWWAHGMSNIKEATHPVSYLAKYASKGGCLKWVPSGARLLGAGGLSKLRRAERAWWMCPAWVREKWGPEHRPMRVKKSSPFKVSTGGGWVSRLTGEIIPSAFRMVAHAQDWSWVKFERVEVAT